MKEQEYQPMLIVQRHDSYVNHVNLAFHFWLCTYVTQRLTSVNIWKDVIKHQNFIAECGDGESMAIPAGLEKFVCIDPTAGNNRK